MVEKRRAKRLKEEHEVKITIISDGRKHPEEKVLCCRSNDLSVLGTKIQVNYYLPVNSLIKMDFNLSDLYHKITAVGKVKWIKALFGDKSYEAGLEFVNSPPEDVEKRLSYISGKSK